MPFRRRKNIIDRTPRDLQVLQSISGLLFAVFLSLHLITTVAAAAGGNLAFDSALKSFRAFYRPNLFVEILLLGVTGIVHVVCACLRISRRLRHPSHRPHSMVVRVHRISGYFLLAFLPGHFIATRVMPTLAHAPTATGKADFAYVAYSLQNWPIFFEPYYFLLGVAGAVHLCLGVGLAMKALFRARVQRLKIRKGASIAAVIAAVAVSAGVVSIIRESVDADRTRFEEYTALYHKYLPFLSPTETKPKIFEQQSE